MQQNQLQSEISAQKHTDPIKMSVPRSEAPLVSGSTAPSPVSEHSRGKRPGVVIHQSSLVGERPGTLRALWDESQVNSILSPGSEDGFKNIHLMAELPASSALPAPGLALAQISEMRLTFHQKPTVKFQGSYCNAPMSSPHQQKLQDPANSWQ